MHNECELILKNLKTFEVYHDNYNLYGNDNNNNNNIDVDNNYINNVRNNKITNDMFEDEQTSNLNVMSIYYIVDRLFQSNSDYTNQKHQLWK